MTRIERFRVIARVERDGWSAHVSRDVEIEMAEGADVFEVAAELQLETKARAYDWMIEGVEHLRDDVSVSVGRLPKT